MTTLKPVVLCILDGWGTRLETAANAPALANTPNFDRLMATCPNASLTTHGPDVGLPSGQMGNSEVGHTNIGAGRIIAMDLGKINLEIEEGSFEKNAQLQQFITTLKATGGTAHVMGLLSDGGVHGHINHNRAAIRVLANAGLRVAVHVITDGRDVLPGTANTFLKDLLGDLPQNAFIASVTGRYFAMDRDNRWERVQTAYEAMVNGVGHAASDAMAAVDNSDNDNTTEEFIPATVIGDYQGAQDGDGFFCLNFRSDRAREILRAIGEPGFAEFETGARPDWAALLGMVKYSADHDRYMTTCYPKQEILNTLGSWVAKHGLRQFRLAETEKYPHVTFFLNGGNESPETGEDRSMPPSPKVATYDLQPEMSAPDVTNELVDAINEKYDLIIVNYANPDMVGHTGDLAAAIAACEEVDRGLGRAVKALSNAGGAMIVTADHGNCETMIDPATGGPHTAHTTNPVPVVLVRGPDGVRLSDGRLADLAPTLLDLMNLELPPEMTGESLIK